MLLMFERGGWVSAVLVAMRLERRRGMRFVIFEVRAC